MNAHKGTMVKRISAALTLAALLALGGDQALGLDVVSNLSGTTNTITDVTDASLTTAVGNINTAITTGPGPADLGVATLDITGTATAAANADTIYGYWTLHGGLNNAANIYGFKSVDINGDKNGSGVRSVLDGDDQNTLLLHITHVKDSISIGNLIIKDADYATTGAAGSPITGGTEIGGGGLLLGGDGFGNKTHYAPERITVSNVEVSGNNIVVGGAIDITDGSSVGDSGNKSVVTNVFGGGILVNGIGLPTGTAPGDLEVQSDVVFNRVDIKDNVASMNMNSAVPGAPGGSAKGGGARIAYSKSFTYDGGSIGSTVSGNVIAGKYAHWVAGGGLSIDAGEAGYYGANEAFETVTLSNIAITGNTAVMVNGQAVDGANAGDTPSGQQNSYARGGGLFFWTESAATITFDKGTVFSNNSAKTFGNDLGLTTPGLTATAIGGGANLQNGAGGITANIKNTNFTDNIASSEYYNALGGGIAITNSGKNTTNSNIVADFSGSTYSGNKAEGVTAAFGGGAYLDAAAGGGTATATYTMNDVEFSGNEATTKAGTGSGSALGGAVYISGAAALSIGGATATGSAFKNNVATTNGAGSAFGGAIYVANAGAAAKKLTIANTAFDGNKAVEATLTSSGASGGAIYDADGNNAARAISKSTFQNNEANALANNSFGGAIYSGAGTGDWTIDDTKFSNNSVTGATASGGAIQISSGVPVGVTGVTGERKITGSTFTNNKATSPGIIAAGGAIMVEAVTGDVTIANSTFSGNSVTSSAAVSLAGGGAVMVRAGAGIGARTITGSTFTDNSASGQGYATGGAVYSGDTALAIDDSSFRNNRAKQGGAIYYSGTTSSLTVTDTDFIGNTASESGGAIFMDTGNGKSVLNLGAVDRNVTISGNKAGGVDNSIYFGVYDNSSSHADGAVLNLTGGRDMALLDGIKADLMGAGAGGFKLNNARTGGTLTLGGASIIDAKTGGADIDFAAAKTAFTDDFTFSAVNQTALVVKDQEAAYTINRSRDGELPLFSYDADATGNSLDLQAGTSTIEFAGNQAVFAFEKDYLVAENLGAGNENNTVGNYGGNANMYMVGDDMWLTLRYQGNQKALRAANRNVLNAGDGPNALDDAITKSNLTDAQYGGLSDFINSAVPGFAVNMAGVGLSGMYKASEMAVKFGLGRYGVPAGGACLDACGGVDVCLNGADASGSFAHRGLRFWTGYIGDFDKMDSHGGLNGYKADRHGFVSGFNYDFGEAGSVGFFGGYSNTKTRARGDGIDAEVKSDAGHFGLIGRFSPWCRLPGFAVNADLGYTFTNNDSRRTMGAAGDVLGSFDQKMFTAGLEFEYALNFSEKGYVAPFLSARYAHVKQDGFSESGLMSATLDKFSGHSFHTRLGAAIGYDFVLGCGDTVITPSLSAAWRHEFGDRRFGTNAVYNVDNPIAFYQESARLDRDSADIGVAVRAARELGNGKKLGVNVGYNLNAGSNQRSHSLYAGLDIGF